jgi:hypothetical protein
MDATNQPVACNEAGKFNPFGEPSLEEPECYECRARVLQWGPGGGSIVGVVEGLEVLSSCSCLTALPD